VKRRAGRAETAEQVGEKSPIVDWKVTRKIMMARRTAFGEENPWMPGDHHRWRCFPRRSGCL